MIRRMKSRRRMLMLGGVWFTDTQVGRFHPSLEEMTKDALSAMRPKSRKEGRDDTPS
jgi:hypothetical protein